MSARTIEENDETFVEFTVLMVADNGIAVNGIVYRICSLLFKLNKLNLKMIQKSQHSTTDEQK